MLMHTNIGILLISMVVLFIIAVIVFLVLFGKDAKIAVQLPPIQGYVDNGDSDIDYVTEHDLKLTNIWSGLDNDGTNH